MKHLSVLFIIAALFCACSKDDPVGSGEPPERPGEPEAPAVPEVFFAGENATEVTVGDEDGSLHIILYREASGSTEPQECLLALGEGSDFASVDSKAVFAKGSSTSNIALRYSPSKMGASQRTATVKMADKDKSLTIKFIKAGGSWTDGGSMLMFDGSGFRLAESKYRLRGDKAEWVLASGTLERHFTVKGSLPEVIAEGGIMPASAYGKAGQWPGVEAESCFGDDFIALNICSLSDGGAEFPHTEYFFRQPGRYAVATVCDGWLLPVVAIDAKLLEPADNRWKAPVRINSDGSVTVFGPYHNGSPLHRVNAYGLSAVWHIDVDGGRASVAPQFSGFSNKDVFDFDFMIAAEGRCENGLSKITFEKPLHNCDEYGQRNASTDCTWGRMLPAVIEIGTPTDF